ncbi:DUF1924 domain-containing protein [Saccharospirillum salsuginis]|uniref:Cytochrome c-type protein SHP n=1 Tax=Saccharospirillum salsuginis TaxID=418750 RepID=A0A918JZX6_9GAMM|nr:DUF1924 domain-containing protein [Saccharospirillum salsuginis]GGX39808.1 cytochrome c-type protein SHP [Saccharospirillum salsuginis]
MKGMVWMLVLLLGSGLSGIATADVAVDELMAEYRAWGVETANPEAGADLWRRTFENDRGCSGCHTADPARTGRHLTTGKVIDPMAPSVNPERLTDVRTIRKWLYRNCKWTLGRECTAQEKADLLAWLRTQ